MFSKLVNKVVNVAIHDGRDVGAGIMDTVVGDAVLRKVVGADFFGTVAGADKGFAGDGSVFHLFFFFAFEESGAQNIHGFDAVLLLRALILHGNDEASREMSDADGGVGGVDTLAAVSTRTVNINTKVFGVDFEVFLGCFGQNCDGGGGSMNAALRFGDWHTLDAVDATFKLELAIGIVATNLENNFFHATGLVFVFGN